LSNFFIVFLVFLNSLAANSSFCYSNALVLLILPALGAWNFSRLVTVHGAVK
jgi:hypothetical protein